MGGAAGPLAADCPVQEASCPCPVCAGKERYRFDDKEHPVPPDVANQFRLVGRAALQVHATPVGKRVRLTLRANMVAVNRHTLAA